MAHGNTWQHLHDGLCFGYCYDWGMIDIANLYMGRVSPTTQRGGQGNEWILVCPHLMYHHDGIPLQTVEHGTKLVMPDKS